MKALILAALLGVSISATAAISAHADHDMSGGFPNETLRILTEQGS